MTQAKTASHPRGIEEGQTLEGFNVIRTVPLPHLKGTFTALEHGATGARYIHIQCPDRENAFGVALKTVPADSTGVAHILEHTVLCGSRQFPVRDPFFSMLKRSLSSFMNAFTASDWTLYPFATQNRKDFYNLLDVYLDAVFYPRLETLSFKQEGHRMELEEAPDDERRLVFKGVVYNEMKGAMSSPDQVLARSLLNALYPDTTYRFNSGGDPEVIPDLSVEDLRAFHQRHYHPSNAYFYSYGNLPLEDHLAFINRKVLDHFERIDPETDVPSQPRWDAPREAVYRYALAPEEDPTRKCQIGVAWLTSDIQDVYEVLVLTLLEQVLLGNPAAPLRRALLESGLGSTLADSTGFDADNRDTLFFCGLKDAAATDAQKIVAIIDDTIARLCAEGVDPDLVESAIHQVEFHRREITNSPYPYGLKLLVILTSTWIHNGRPDRLLQIDKDIARLRTEMAEPQFFEKRLRRHFLDNPHRVVFKLLPDTLLAENARKAEEERLQRTYERLSEADIHHIDADAAALKRLQEEEEDVSVLPTLGLDDIPPEVNRVAPTSASGLHLTHYEQPTGGIFYLSSALGISAVPPEDLTLLPLFCYAASRMGTRHRDYLDLARFLDRYTGGFGLAVQARSRFDSDNVTVPMITIGGKCLDRNTERLFTVLEDVLDEIRFTDLDQLRRVMLEFRALQESAVIHNGHRLAISLANRGLTLSAYLNEIWQGIHQLQSIKALTAAFENDGAELEITAQRLARIARALFHRGNLTAALIGPGDALAKAVPRATALLDRLADSPAPESDHPAEPPHLPVVHEGWHTGTAVSFVARTYPCVRYTHPDAPALAVAAKMLRSLYLHREIREKGGAYGGFAIYNPEEGLFSCGSYRDPHIVRTLDVFSAAGDFMANGTYDAQDIHEAVLQVCSEIDRPDPPGPAARKAFYRQLVGLEDEVRQQFKARLLTLTPEAVKAVAGRYLARPEDQAATVVISSRAMLDQANQTLTAKPLALHAI